MLNLVLLKEALFTNMNVLFLCCAYSENQKELFRKSSKRGYQYAAQNLQEALIDGFWENGVQLKVLSIPSLSTYPMGSKIAIVDNAPFVYKGVRCGESVGYVNIPYLKRARRNVLNTIIDSWYESTKGEKCIFVYALLLLQMDIAIAAKKRHPDIKLCIIVPDLPRFMGYNAILKKLGYQERSIKRIYQIVRDFDAFVVLARPMLDDLHVRDKPSVVVEGIYSGDGNLMNVSKEKEKVVLYTGNIDSRYGIDMMIEAFSLIKSPDYRLWIRGNGDNSRILEKASADNRIKYIGPLSKEELVVLQKKATLLINPVPPEEEFTKYFFPSKTMDYLASGTPTVMFKLDCLPSDYYEHLFFFKEHTPQSMADTIESICNKNSVELDAFGENAVSFIKEKKNARMQVSKIVDLLRSIQ